MNQFFNPDSCPFEVIGFDEEFVDATTFKSLGSRRVSEPTRPCGSPGRALVELTEDVTLRKGMRGVVVKASPERPRKVWSMLQILCGRTKESLTR